MIYKKLLCVIICLALVMSCVFGLSSSAAEKAEGTDIPLIYIVGTGYELVADNEDGTQRRVYPIDLPVDDLLQVAKDNIDMFAKALITQEWTDFGNLLADTISPYYHTIALDENGNAPDGSHCSWTYDKAELANMKVNGKYPTQAFEFNYDWRMDPYKTAELLHQYIEDVLEATGEDHVAMMGRCLGACIASAYMEKYDGEYVTDLIYYAGAHKGATVCSKLFSGDLYLDDDGIERFCYDLSLPVDEMTGELIKAFVTVFNETYGLDFLCWAVNNVWQDIYIQMMPQILIDSFGTFPGFWSMVDDSDYARAKDNVFHNADMEKWAPFIGIIDNYHNNVQLKLDDNLKKYQERGIVVSDITKYGYQAMPISAPADDLSDSYCSANQASMGATTATMFSELGKDYLASVSDKYVSPDKQIDASTCLFPERTWFIKNMEHKDFPDTVNYLMNEIVNSHGMTVETNADFPQYMVYDGETIFPMTAENNHTTQRYETNFWESLKILFRNLFAMLKNALASKKSA